MTSSHAPRRAGSTTDDASGSTTSNPCHDQSSADILGGKRPTASNEAPDALPADDAATTIGAVSAAGGRWLRWRQQAIELLKFGAVGGAAYVVDVGLMNFLRFGPGELLGDKALTAKVISVTVATMVAWLGNRHWTFSAKKRSSRGKELVWFLLVNAGGMLIAVGTLGVSHYVLDLTSPLADNISANVIGLALGTAFRYFCYRYLVFNGEPNSVRD